MLSITSIKNKIAVQRELIFFEQVANNLWKDATWRAQVNQNLDDLEMAADEIYAIGQVPTEAADLHTIYMESANEVHQVVMHNRQYMKTGNAEDYKKFLERIYAYLELMDKTIEELDKLRPET